MSEVVVVWVVDEDLVGLVGSWLEVVGKSVVGSIELVVVEVVKLVVGDAAELVVVELFRLVVGDAIKQAYSAPMLVVHHQIIHY